MNAGDIQRSPPEPVSTDTYTRALLNILEDFSEEKRRFENTQRAVFNILEDFSGEKEPLKNTQRAVLNILEDFSEEKSGLESIQKALLNLLEDFDVEKAKTEAVNKELSSTLNEKENLIKEIHHRVKNNLQIIHSMLNLQMSYVRDEKAIELFKESKNRVYSIALIHERLYQSESLAKIDFPEYIRSLTGNIFVSYGVSERSITPKIDVENVAFDIDTLIPCALIITELISNSLKHAFPDISGKKKVNREIRIRLRHDVNNKLVLIIGDNGRGMPEDFNMEKSKSLGLKLVNVLVKQLRGTIQLAQGGTGTEFMITFKADK